MPFGSAAHTVRVTFVGETKQLEARLAALGLVAEGAGDKIGRTFDAGTSKAAAGLDKLSAAGASWGVPFAETVGKVGKQFDHATAKSQAFTDALAATGKMALMAGGVGFAAASGEALKLAVSFQTATTSLSNNAGITLKAAKDIGNAFLNIRSHFSGNEITAAFARVAGQLKLTEGQALDTAQSVEFMHAAIALASATNTDLGVSTSALARIMQAYHLSVNQASQASDTLYNVSRALNQPIDSIVKAMARLHSRLGELAPSMNDVAGLMVELGGNGITSQRGIRVVNSALQKLIGNSKHVTTLLADLGVHIFNSQGKFVGLGSVIEQLQPKFQQMTQHQRLLAAQILFGSQASQVMAKIVMEGVPAFDAAARAASKTGTAHKAEEQNAKTLQHQLETLKATIEDLGTKFGNYLVPKVEALGAALQTSIGWLEKHKTAAHALGVVIGGFLATSIAVFAYQKAAVFVSATKNMATGIGKFAQAVVTAATTSEAEMAGVGTSAQTMEGEVVGAADGTAAGVDAALSSTGIGLVLIAAGVAVMELATHWKQAMDTIRSVTESVVNFVIGKLNTLIGVFNSTIGQLTGTISTLGNANFTGSGSQNMGNVADTRFGQVNVPSFASQTGRPILPNLPKGHTAEEDIIGYLQSKGFSKVAIAGILGNFAQESGGQTLSGINPALNGASGLGIAQWMGSRRAAEATLAKREGVAPNSLAVELQYLDQELQTTYHSAFKAIQNAATPALAAKLFEQLFEGAGTPNLPARERLAAEAYGELGGGGGGGGGKGIPGLGGALSPSGGGNKATMRYWHHRPVGKMTQAQWQAFLLTHQTPANRRELLYANPLPGMTSIGRVDEGLDFGATPGSAVDAIGAGIVTSIIKNWYKGQPLIEERLTQGPDKGKYVYYAEQLKSLVHIGQQVAAGQRIGTVAASGTGLELGFGASGGRTLAKATTGYVEGQVTPAGQAFKKFYDSLGRGIYETINGKTGAISGGGQNASVTIGDLIQKFIAALNKATSALIQSYQNLEQNGSVRLLEKSLGVSTGGTIGVPGIVARWRMPFGNQPWHLIHGTVQEGRGLALAHAIHGISGAGVMHAIQSGQSPTGLDKSLVPLLNKMAAGSSAEKHYQDLLVQLVAAGQIKQAKALEKAHGAAMATLAQELYAQQVTKDAESLSLEATQEKDRTQIMNDTAAKQLTIMKDGNQRIVDAMQAAATKIKDTTQVITDVLSAMAQKITDDTQAMADASNAVVQGINDQTQIRVDILGERGLYGLNLLAQQQQVQLDIMKAGFDQQIAIAQQNLDTVKSTQNTDVEAAQRRLDQVTLAQDQKVALAQQNLDTVQLAADVKMAAAQAHTDSVTLAADVGIQLAQTAVDLSASAPKAQQDIAAAQLHQATASGGLLEAVASIQQSAANNAANEAVGKAANALATAQGTAAEVEASAQQALATAQGNAAVAIAQATEALTGIQGTAAQAEATQQGLISTTQEQAQTQYAGGGIQLNIYGQNLADPLATANDVGWALRPFLPA